MAKILIVDDDTLLCEMLIKILQNNGHSVQSALSLTEGIELARQQEFDIVLLDVQFPTGSGLDSLPQFSEVPSNPEVIIMTGIGDSDGAQKAISSGAWAYLEKPNVVRDIMLPLTRALQYRSEKQKAKSIPIVLHRDSIIGSSPALTNCLNQVALASISNAPVLITGATGTGKELFAKAVHDNSERKAESFVVVDCASLPNTLIESSLFGHVKGAFSGADSSHDGLVHLADGGTIFLDEVGELPLTMQKKFLRVLHEKRYRPIGSSKELFSDFRIIAATNKNLHEMVKKGRFRDDLLYRLKSFHLELPELSARISDLSQLVHHFVDKFCKRQKVNTKIISTEFIDSLQAYPWPGNVRELQQILEEACCRAINHNTLFSFHLPDYIRIAATNASLRSSNGTISPPSSLHSPPPPWKDFRTGMESQYLDTLMSFCKNNKQMACEISGLSRARLYQLLKK